jgi:hypothetical protein
LNSLDAPVWPVAEVDVTTDAIAAGAKADER